ncbi:S1 family peptidase [Nonomuraea roseola]|uniref:Serine protease n=1 Tax=Nonomuraea roseola TaxID=46179 RepID=A0ABV5PTJ0_9ACTN
MEGSIVRVVARGAGGTGFFVAPGLVLTCAHVIGHEAGSSVRIVMGGQVFAGTVTARHPAQAPAGEPFPLPDLALIEVPGAPADLDCVRFDLGPPQVEDRIHTIGHTRTWSRLPGAEPATFTYEGLHRVDGGSLLKLASGQAVPGMSGGPLLNLATGGVCGILKTSRDPGSPHGGWGVPADAVAQLFPEAFDASERFHTERAGWHDPGAAQGLIVDLGRVREESPGGKPGEVLFTVTDATPEKVKLTSVRALVRDRSPSLKPHHRLAEGVPEQYDLDLALTPHLDSYELLDVHHVLDPGETEGYRVRVTSPEGWRYRLEFVVGWHRLGSADPQETSLGPVELTFRVKSEEALTALVRRGRTAVAGESDDD